MIDWHGTGKLTYDHTTMNINERLGYQFVSQVAGYYERREAAVVMGKSLMVGDLPHAK